MNQRKRIQIIPPNMLTASTCTPLTLRGAMPADCTMRATRATITGLPTISAMKIVRRDQSISPIESPNTRQAPVKNEVVRGTGVAVTASPGT
jgi:hypothetical protein